MELEPALRELLKNKTINDKLYTLNKGGWFVMPKSKDITGMKFGKLTVECYLGSRFYSGRKRRFYKAVCECGGSIELPGDSIKYGKTSSCGCLKWQFGPNNPKWGGHGEISGNYWDHILRGAKNRSYIVTVTIEDAWDLFLKQNRKCALSGLSLTFGVLKEEEKTASLDRIDSKDGYTLENVQWVHKDINRMKQHFNESRFINLCKIVANHKRDKNV